MAWVAIGISGIWLLVVNIRCEKIEEDIDRLERVQGGQLYREAQRYPPRRR